MRDSNGDLIGGNDNWKATQRAELVASSLQPAHDTESALFISVAAGAYTAIVKGNNGGTGVGLVEIYHLQ